MRPERLDALGKIDAIEQARQANIRKHQRNILALARQDTHCLLGVLAFDDAQVSFLQQSRTKLAQVRIVLDDQRDWSLGFVRELAAHVVTPRFEWSNGARCEHTFGPTPRSQLWLRWRDNLVAECLSRFIAIVACRDSSCRRSV